MKFKVTTVILSILALSVWLLSCADVPSNGPAPPEFNSEFSFANAAEDLGDVAVTVDGQSVGTVAFGAATSHATYPAGSRTVTLGSGDSFPVAMTTDQRATVLILPLSGATREFIKLVERRIFDAAATSSARVRVVHASLDAGEVDITLTGADTVASTLSYRGVSNYASVPAGDYTVTISLASDGTVLGTSTTTLSNMRQTGVLVGSIANGTLDLVGLQDN